MSTRNRQKRTAKQRARTKRGPTPPQQRPEQDSDFFGDPSWQRQPPPSIDELAQRLLNAATSRFGKQRASDLADEHHEHPGIIGKSAERAMRHVIGNLWQAGWLPVDLWQVIRRRCDDHAASLIVDAVAGEIAQYPSATVHQRFDDQLAALDAHQWWDRSRPHLGQWAEQHGLTLGQALGTVVATLAELMTLPELPPVVALPGKAAAADSAAAAGVDQKVLTRVRGLLAKAESTAYPEEAEALSAKAQELMNRHAFERALLDAHEHKAQRAGSCRIWLDNPYSGAKAQLVSTIAAANRCRSVHYHKIGFVALVGDELDLEITELLSTSLLVQATQAMVARGSQTARDGTSRTRSFRQSFLIAYSGRIGERLEEAEQAAHDPVEDESLLPVLADRGQIVDNTFHEMFPNLTYKPVSVSNGAGWHAGRAAADSANISLERTSVTA